MAGMNEQKRAEEPFDIFSLCLQWTTKASEGAMIQERYFQWMRIWKWFAVNKGTQSLGNLHSMLDFLWQEERKNCMPGELPKHAGAWEHEDVDFVNDPDYQAFQREMDRAFGRDSE
jgi:hypothetical protein